MNLTAFGQWGIHSISLTFSGSCGAKSMTIHSCQMNPSTLVIFPIFCVLLLVASCIMIPIPTPESKILAGTPVTEEQLDFLNLESTTKQVVMERLGNPDFFWEDEHIFTYNWDMRQGILFWAIGGMSQGAMAGGGGITDIPKHYLLLIQFDEQDRVHRWERAMRPVFQPYIDFLQDWAELP